MASRRVTETPNALTDEIDVANPIGVVRLLRTADAQLFAGYGTHAGLYDDEPVDGVLRAARAVATALRHPRGRVIVTGSGTSGRLAYVTTRAFNELLGGAPDDADAAGSDGAPGDRPPARRKPFAYLIAGGDPALVKAQEGAEDDGSRALRDLQGAIGEGDLEDPSAAGSVVVIGVSCGLSAAYVRAHMAWALEAGDAARPILIGFTPPATAPKLAGEEGAGVVQAMVADEASHGRSIVLTPVVGPEAIAGSTRMKGGSATLMLLNTIFGMAVADVCGVHAPGSTTSASALAGSAALAHRAVRKSMLAYETAVRETYVATPAIAALVDMCGNALRSGGSVNYLGEGTAAIFGFVDSSECPPTYGAAFNDVRGYVVGGWNTLAAAGGDPRDSMPSDSSERQYYARDDDDFKATLPTLGSDDVVILLALDSLTDRLVELGGAAAERGCSVAAIVVDADGSRNLSSGGATHSEAAGGAGDGGDASSPIVEAALGGSSHEWLSLNVHVSLSETDLFGLPCLAEMAMKLLLNAASTGAHIRKGAVCHNRMVDLTVTNVKLFHRAVGIVQHFSGINVHGARKSLLRAIYKRDDVNGMSVDESEVPAHVTVAAAQRRVLPLALVLAGHEERRGEQLSVSDAQRLLDAEPVVRTLVSALDTGKLS